MPSATSNQPLRAGHVPLQHPAFDVTNPKLNSGYQRYLPLTRRVEHRGVAMCRLSGRTLTKFRVIQDEEPSCRPQPQLKLGSVTCRISPMARIARAQRSSTSFALGASLFLLRWFPHNALPALRDLPCAICPARCGSSSYSQWRDCLKSVWSSVAKRRRAPRPAGRRDSRQAAWVLPCLNGDTPWSTDELAQQRSAKCLAFQSDYRSAYSTIGSCSFGK